MKLQHSHLGMHLTHLWTLHQAVSPHAWYLCNGPSNVSSQQGLLILLYEKMGLQLEVELTSFWCTVLQQSYTFFSEVCFLTKQKLICTLASA